MAEESQYLSFQGIRIHYCVHAPADPPRERVLLLSSPLASSFHWRKLVPELTQLGCLVVLADPPGFGRSDCGMDVPQNITMHANMIWGLLDEIDRQTEAPDSMWHLCGHATACATLLEMASLYPDSVKSQVHISPLLGMPENPKDDPARWYQESVLSRDNFHRTVEKLSGYPMDDYIIDRMRAPLLRPGARLSFLRMVKALRKAQPIDLGFCPAMALIGGRDFMMGDEARKAIEARLSGAETHVLKSAGHFPMETHSKALRDYLRGWIRYNAQSIV